MIVEPHLLTHWKYNVLSHAVGDALALKSLITLWSHVQYQKQWIMPLHSCKLGAICRIPDEDDQDRFWEAMTDPNWPWLEQRGAGWWEVRGWAERNRTLISAWTARTKRLPWMDEYEKAVPGGSPAIPWAKEKLAAGGREAEW